jgi:hypothetical protein
MKNNNPTLTAKLASAKKLTIAFCAVIVVLTACTKKNMLDKEPAAGATAATSPRLTTNSTFNTWYDKFVAYDNAYGANNYNSTSSATLAWNESYLLRGYVIMYEVTKNTSWLTKLTTHVDAILANATDLGGDGYLDWGTDKYDNRTFIAPYMVHDGMICLPIARFIRLVHRNSTTLSAFAAKATTYQNFIQTNIAPKWSDVASWMGNCWTQYSTSTGWYAESANWDAFPGVSYTRLPYNMMNVFAEMLYTMYDVNGNSWYKDKADGISQNFKNGLTAYGTGYSWTYVNGTATLEDTSHGDLDIGLAVENFNRNGTITGTTIANLSHTMTANMWNQSVTAPIVDDNVKGTAGTHVDTRVLGDWVRLTQFDAKNWKIAAEQYRSYTPPVNMEPEAYTLAQLVAWDPVKVQNQGFEYKFFSDTTLPARWVRFNTPNAAIIRSTSAPSSGQACAAITSTTGDGIWQGLYQDWTEYTPGVSYTVTFDVKTSGTAGARIFMYNNTAGTVIGVTHDFDNITTWNTAQTFTFTAPAAGTAVRIYLENHYQSNAGTAYFDNVVIKRTGDAF